MIIQTLVAAINADTQNECNINEKWKSKKPSDSRASCLVNLKGGNLETLFDVLEEIYNMLQALGV